MGNPLDDVLNELSSGKNSKGLQFEAFKGTDIGLASHVPFGIPTRIPQLDLSIGRSGWPAGRVIEIFGFEHAGKSSLALAAIASVQRMGGFGVWADTERTFDPNWAAMNGCDPSNIIIAYPDTVEGIFSTQKKTIDAIGTVDSTCPVVLVADSVTAVPSLESLEKDFSDVQRIGTDARATRNGMRKLVPFISDSKVCVIYINHSISKTAATPFAKQSTSAGGHAIKFWSSIRVEMVNCGVIKSEKEGDKYKEGIKVKITIEKNKVGNTGKLVTECELLKTGFDLSNNLFDALVSIGEIKKVNSKTFSFTIPGKDEVMQFSRKEFPTIIDQYSNGVDQVYEWFLAVSVQKGLIKNYA